ncbi:TIGR00341 family protein [Salinarchaeum sp. IM2453]|uniref:TIGR00341 family protein n=1 Tax=Salinarchaeum sp. IM2453 TaxID=2862870 RepID=UPI001C83547E|nr:TIGR00341 family protein [Salinarchaeum sp. IM2453]QZA87885.1 TIGR00341 family protein [Salinarchaeum sp. IM2453]
MRLVQLTVSSEEETTVHRVLKNYNADYIETDETSDRNYSAVIYVPLPKNAVEPLLEELRNAGISQDGITVIVEASTIESNKFNELQEKYAENKSEERIAREELQSTAQDLLSSRGHYYTLTVISTVVATAGLLLNSPAIVIGAMVIAPLVGPALAASTGVVTNNDELRSQGVLRQIYGAAGAVLAATVFAASIQILNVVPPGIDILGLEQVRGRFAPDFLALIVAIGAGIAGALSLSAGVSAALVGVMIAAALIPPAAVVGIGLAWSEFTLVAGAGILLGVNILSINLSALMVLWYQGYRPEHWFEQSDARSMMRVRVAALVIGILVLSVFLVGVTFMTNQAAAHEQTIQTEVDNIVDDHSDLTLIDTEVETNDHPLRSSIDQVTVTVGREGGTDLPPLADQIKDRINETVGESVAIDVRFIEQQRR